MCTCNATCVVARQLRRCAAAALRLLQGEPCRAFQAVLPYFTQACGGNFERATNMFYGAVRLRFWFSPAVDARMAACGSTVLGACSCCTDDGPGDQPG